jgi:hypothetical protein
MIGVTSSIGQEKTERAKECKLENFKPAKFKVVETVRGTSNPPVLGLRIVVADKNFNREFMMRLVETIRSRYCEETIVGVTIFDDEEIAESVVFPRSGGSTHSIALK